MTACSGSVHCVGFPQGVKPTTLSDRASLSSQASCTHVAGGSYLSLFNEGWQRDCHPNATLHIVFYLESTAIAFSKQTPVSYIFLPRVN